MELPQNERKIDQRLECGLRVSQLAALNDGPCARPPRVRRRVIYDGGEPLPPGFLRTDFCGVGNFVLSELRQILQYQEQPDHFLDQRRERVGCNGLCLFAGLNTIETITQK